VCGKLRRFVRNYGEMCGNLFVTQGPGKASSGNDEQAQNEKDCSLLRILVQLVSYRRQLTIFLIKCFLLN